MTVHRYTQLCTLSPQCGPTQVHLGHSNISSSCWKGIFWLPDGILCHPGVTRIGRDDAPVPQDITIEGPGIEAEHCVIENRGGVVTLDPCSHLCSLDGVPVNRPTQLTQGMSSPFLIVPIHINLFYAKVRPIQCTCHTAGVSYCWHLLVMACSAIVVRYSGVMWHSIICIYLCVHMFAYAYMR